MASYQKKPLVSVCIPTYNKARYLRKFLESIINQTYRNLENIISDNASTDNTGEMVKSFSDDRVKYCRNPTNIGCCHLLSQIRTLVGHNFIYWERG